MASGVDYLDGDRSIYSHEDSIPPSHAHHLNSGESPAPGVGPNGLETYPYDHSNLGGYDEQNYPASAHIDGSTAEHDRDRHHNHSETSLGDGPGGEFTMVSREGGDYDDYGADEDAANMLLGDNEPLPELDNYVEDVVQPGFDEAILRALCDMDVRRCCYTSFDLLAHLDDRS